MTERRTRRGPARPGRRAGESGTREAILEAARGRFAGHGYQGATIRAIAADAGVDPALVHHFFGTKEALFAAAMRIPVVPSEVVSAALAAGHRDQTASFPGRSAGGRPDQAEGPRSGGGPPGGGAGTGERLVRTALTLWESPEMGETFTGLLRSAVTSEAAAVMLREFVTESILGTVIRVTGLTERWGEREAEFRAGLVASQMVGLAMTRLILGLPTMTGASVEELAAAVGPTVQRYLMAEIPRPAGDRSGPGPA